LFAFSRCAALLACFLVGAPLVVSSWLADFASFSFFALASLALAVLALALSAFDWLLLVLVAASGWKLMAFSSVAGWSAGWLTEFPAVVSPSGLSSWVGGSSRMSVVFLVVNWRV
jgi:hypothetical protein